MTRLLRLLAAACLVLAGGCSPGREAAAPATVATEVEQRSASPTVDPVGVVDPKAEAGAKATDAVIGPDEASLNAAYQACLQRPKAPAPINEKPPTNAKGWYANKGRCLGCSLGWWQTGEPVALRAEPDDNAAQTATVPAGVWLYAVEAISFMPPSRGIVVKSSEYFKQCATVYHVFMDQDEEDSWDTVWQQGELLSYVEGEESSGVIHWFNDPSTADPGWNKGDGWWTQLKGLNGEAGWTWVNYRENAFSCKYDRDPEEVCVSKPKEPPPGVTPSPP